MTRNIVNPLPAAALVAVAIIISACTPQEQCIWRNTSEYRTVSDLLEEVEGNLARGYAWEERPITRTEWDDCPRVIHDKEGNSKVITVPCSRRVTDTERYRVPIDPMAEERKRDGLHERLARLTPAAEAATKACRAAYPDKSS